VEVGAAAAPICTALEPPEADAKTKDPSRCPNQDEAENEPVRNLLRRALPAFKALAPTLRNDDEQIHYNSRDQQQAKKENHNLAVHILAPRKAQATEPCWVMNGKLVQLRGHD